MRIYDLICTSTYNIHRWQRNNYIIDIIVMSEWNYFYITCVQIAGFFQTFSIRILHRLTFIGHIVNWYVVPIVRLEFVPFPFAAVHNTYSNWFTDFVFCSSLNRSFRKTLYTISISFVCSNVCHIFSAVTQIHTSPSYDVHRSHKMAHKMLHEWVLSNKCVLVCVSTSHSKGIHNSEWTEENGYDLMWEGSEELVVVRRACYDSEKLMLFCCAICTLHQCSLRVDCRL